MELIKNPLHPEKKTITQLLYPNRPETTIHKLVMFMENVVINTDKNSAKKGPAISMVHLADFLTIIAIAGAAALASPAGGLIAL
jgi:hypothetical protein